MQTATDTEFDRRSALIQDTLSGHFWTLSFPPQLESEFLDAYRRHSVTVVRRILPFLSIVYVATCALMVIGTSGADVGRWVDNVLIPVGAALGWLWIALYTPRLAGGVHWHTALAVGFALVCTLRAVMLFAGSPLSAYVPYHVVYVLVILFTVVRLRLVYAGLVAILAAGAGGAMVLAEGLQIDLLAFAQYYVITAFLAGVIGYAIEHRERADFLRSQLLHLEKQEFARLRAASDAEAARQRMQGNYLKLVSGNLSPAELGERTLRFLAEELGVLVSAFFSVDNGQARRLAVRGVDPDGLDAPEIFDAGTSLVGQMLAHPRTVRLRNLPEGYLRIRSSVVHGAPPELLVLPVQHNDDVLAIVELARLSPFGDDEVALAERILQSLGMALLAARARGLSGDAAAASGPGLQPA
ncbi:MAG: GAF domain-containing protein [Pseudomonadota bacterium]